MIRAALLMTLCAVLAACDQSPAERIAELDKSVTVDCGDGSGEYGPPAPAQAMVACMNDALAAGDHARARLDYYDDFLSWIYTVDGAFVHIYGFTDLYDGDIFVEWRCTTFEAPERTLNGRTEAQVGTTDCAVVREW